jgi:hypothetical protein
LNQPGPLRAIQLPFHPDLRIFAITLDQRASGQPAGAALPRPDLIRTPKADLPKRAPRKPDGPAVGFVVHPHEPHFEEYTLGGARTMLSNVVAWRMRDVDKRYVDFDWPAKNLRFCYENDLTVAPIIDNSLLWGGGSWVGRYANLKGEGIISNDGRHWTWPSPYSPIYRQETARYADEVIRWVKANDPDHRVIAYLNGAEWFWQGSFDYNPLMLDHFRESLAERYGDIAKLNEAWGTSYAGFDEAQAPRLFRAGNPTSDLVSFEVGNSWDDASWFRSRDRDIEVQPGEEFEAEALYQIKNAPANLVDIQGIWVDANGANLGWSWAEVLPDRDDGWHTLRWQDKAPPQARKLWIHLKVYGPGTVTFDHLVVRRLGPTPKVLLDDGFADAKKEGWQFASWMGKCDGRMLEEGHKDPGSLQIVIQPQEQKYGNTSAAVVDYVEFTWEALADAVEHQASVIKGLDPTRPVASYLGFAWAMPTNWDDVMCNAAIDVTCKRAKSLDIIGLQLCSAKGDFHYATATIDIARKYGKPIWATDLIDFTHGTYVGFETLDQLTQGCIQHGMDGVFWYCWYGTPDYNYYTGLKNEEIQALVHNAEDSIRELSGREIRPRVAMVNPVVPYWLGDPGGLKNDPFDSYGWYKLLSEMQLAVDVWTPYELAHAARGDLSRYRVIVLPDSQFLPMTAFMRLIQFAFAGSGGSLVVSGRPPALSPQPAESNGHLTILDMFDAGGAVSKEQRLRFDTKAGRDYLGRMKRFRVAGNTPPLFIEVEGKEQARSQGHKTQQLLREFLRKAGVTLPLDENEHRVEAVTYEGPEDTTLFLLRGEGVQGPIVDLHVGVGSDKATVKADHGEWKPVTVKDGHVTLPGFRNVCLVRWPKAG